MMTIDAYHNVQLLSRRDDDVNADIRREF